MDVPIAEIMSTYVMLSSPRQTVCLFNLTELRPQVCLRTIKPANNDHDSASNQPLLRKVPATSTSSNTVTPPASSNVTQTRSGQIVKPNNLYKDFVQ